MSSIYTIIVSYNGEKWIRKCLTSVSNSTIEVKIIIVDNNSKDNTVKIIEEEYPNILVLKQTKNLGFGGGNNLGIKYALDKGADYVFLLNQDAYVEADTIKNLTTISKSNLDYGILSPIHLNGEGNKLDKLFAHYTSYDYNKTFSYDAIKGKLSKIYQVPFVNAAAWLVPKNTLEKIGGFDPLFFHYGEDDNYCQRLNYHGSKVGVVTSSFIMHDREPVLNEKTIDYNSIKEKEKHYKIRWANINIESQLLISKQVKELKKKLYKSYFKFNFKIVNNYKAELRLVKRIKKNIIISRTINKKLGNHYLN